MEIGSKIRELRIGKGFTQEYFAKLTGFSKSYIQKFEENRRDINTSQLVKLANALNVSISEILSSSNFNTKDYKFSNIEFRDKNNLYNIDEFKKSITSDLYPKFYAYETLEEVLNEGVKFKNPILNEPNISDNESIEFLAKKLRKKWKFGDTPIYDLVGFLEDLGIKIFEVDREDNFVGFSCWMKKTPVIVLNTRNKDIPRRRFTILHEISHLLLKFDDGLSENMVERFCDQFAGAMLLPETALKEYLSSDSISLEELRRIKERFGISIRAILVRMVSVGFITWDKYREWVELYHSWRDKEANYNGRETVSRFDYLLARALRERKITDNKASELMKMPISYLRNNYLSKEFSI
ncbi:conserved hypothetical protein [Tenacibaculum maritimum]|uniref:helix-turn-helix domain-containing protein n=1 Tax=Tenacibaculum maritimum TaxID=107401 RepID=UPI0012E673A1|nr:XRE family transcriptional regulator [Tenacibaculum maritimum]CAA0163246.1 conserved hypothetical protein [Tenacibaculum maritimum]CAA0173393.1 Zn-dependent peptidase ImmA, M78 family [Tenacibaculum maritimum]